METQESLLQAAIVALREGRDAEACACSQRAITQGAVIRDIYYIYALALSRSGNLPAAKDALLNELRLFPDNTQARELLTSLSGSAPLSISSQAQPDNARLEECLKLIQTGKAAQAIDQLLRLRAQAPSQPFLHHLLGLAYATLGKFSYAHEMFWEEIALDPSNRVTRSCLKQLNKKAVLDDFEASSDERNPHLCLSQHINLITSPTISGGFYAEARTANQQFDATPNEALVRGLAAALRGDMTEAKQCLAKPSIGPLGAEVRGLLERNSWPAQAGARWTIVHELTQKALSSAYARSQTKKYVVLFPGVDIWTGDRVNDLGRQHFEPIFRELAGDPNVEVTFLTIDGRHGLQGTNYRLGTIRVNRRPDALIVMHPWWGEEHVTALAARERGIPVIVSEHGAHFSDFSLIEPKGDIREACYPAHASCIWCSLDHEIVTQNYKSKDSIIITGNPMHDELAQAQPKPLPGTQPGYTLILSAGQGVKRELLLNSARAISKFSPVVVKAHPLEPDIDGWRREFPTFTAASDLYPAVFHAKRVLAYISNALVPALLWRKPCWIMKDDRPDPVYDDFVARHRGIFNYKNNASFTSADFAAEVQPPADTYERFAYLSDGKNGVRVADVARIFAL